MVRSSSMMRVALAALSLAAACGGGGPAGGIKQRGHKLYSTLGASSELAGDAADPTLGVILATGDGGQATLLELRPQGEVTLEVSGIDAAVRVRLTASALAAPQVVGELPVALAAVAAARALGKDATGYRWELQRAGDAVGSIGSAATAALAVGFAACLTGATLDRRAVVIGALLPDGSLGMAEGLPEHVATMVAAGKRKIGVPAGLAAAISARSGRAVALGSLVRDRGAELVPVADVGEAYRLMTGGALPEPRPMPARQAMGLVEPRAIEAIAQAYVGRQQRMVGDWAALLMLDNAARLPARIGQLAAVAQREAKLAEQLRVAGQWSAALDRLGEAWALSAAAVGAWRVVELVQLGKLDEAVALLRDRGPTDGATPPVGPLHQIGAAATTAATGGAQLHLLATAGAALSALAQAEAGQPPDPQAAGASGHALVALETLRGLPPGELGSAAIGQQVAGWVVPYLAARERARAASEAALLSLGLPAGGGGPARSPAELVRSLPLEAVRLRWIAELQRGAAGGAAPSAELALLQLPAAWPADVAAVRARWGGASAAWSLLRWAASLTATEQAAAQRALRESLGARIGPWDGSLSIAAGPTAAALPALVAAADRHARQAASAAHAALGAVPLAQALAYQLGHQLATRAEPALLARGLLALWWSSALGEAAVALARTAPRSPPTPPR